MSYDINFWKQEGPLELSAQEIYERLSQEERVTGVANLPVTKILVALKETFPDFNHEEDFPLVSIGEGSIEFSWTDQFFRFDIRGEIGAKYENILVKTMAQFNCPMYDPQEGKRYDKANGMELGELPKFEDFTAEQREEMARLQQQILDEFSKNGGSRKGCGTAMLGVSFFVAIVVFVSICQFV